MVSVIATEAIDKTKQWVFITLEVDGEIIEHTTVQPWNTDSPLFYSKDLYAWCQTQEDRYRLEILKDMYPNARPKGRTLAEFKRWILDGRTNGAIMEDGVEVTAKTIIKKVVLNRHQPKRLKIVGDINNVKSINDLKLILLDMVK